MNDIGFVNYSSTALKGLIHTSKLLAAEVREELIKKEIEKYQERFATKRRFFGLLDPKPLKTELKEDFSNYDEVIKEIDNRVKGYYSSIWDIDWKHDAFVSMLDKIEYASNSKSLNNEISCVQINLEVYNSICYLTQKRKFKYVRH